MTTKRTFKDPQRPKINWQPLELLFCVSIGAFLVFGLGSIYFPVYAWMDKVDRQASAFILLAVFCGCYGVVWLIHKVRS